MGLLGRMLKVWAKPGDGIFVSPGPSAVGAPGRLRALPAMPRGQDGAGQPGGLAPGVEKPLSLPQWPPAGSGQGHGLGSGGEASLLL